jgi:hypothetical protein
LSVADVVLEVCFSRLHREANHGYNSLLMKFGFAAPRAPHATRSVIHVPSSMSYRRTLRATGSVLPSQRYYTSRIPHEPIMDELFAAMSFLIRDRRGVQNMKTQGERQ